MNQVCEPWKSLEKKHFSLNLNTGEFGAVVESVRNLMLSKTTVINDGISVLIWELSYLIINER